MDELILRHGKGDIVQFGLFETLPEGLRQIEGVREVIAQEETGKITLFVSGLSETLPEILAFFNQRGIRPHSLECRKMTLDDLFIQLTGRPLAEG